MDKNKKKKPSKTYTVYEYSTDNKVFSENHILAIMEDYYSNRIEALPGVKTTFNLCEEMIPHRGLIEFYTPGNEIYILSHDTTIYVSATLYHLKEVIDTCPMGCRGYTMKVKNANKILRQKETLE